MTNPAMKYILMAALAPFSAVHAAISTTTFQVTATVADACTIVASNHDFGIYQATSLADNINGLSTVTATCTLGALYQIGLDVGAGVGATVGTRKMIRTGGSELLNYSLYQTADRLTVFGNSLGLDTLPAVGTGLAVGHPVYGKIPASQNVPAGGYSDTITATINF